MTGVDGLFIGSFGTLGVICLVKYLVQLGDKSKEDIQEFPDGSQVFYSNWENKVRDCKIIQYLGEGKYIIDAWSEGLKEVSRRSLYKINKLDVKA